MWAFAHKAFSWFLTLVCNVGGVGAAAPAMWASPTRQSRGFFRGVRLVSGLECPRTPVGCARKDILVISVYS
jgi:hypothetical protein